MKLLSFLILGSVGCLISACDPSPPQGCSEGGVGGGPACPPKQFCGGIAAIACPGAGTCVDDPSDNCNPDKGGADCGGVCECNAQALCTEGYEFDDSPAVCGCVPIVTDPCAAVRCRGGYHCEAVEGKASCVPDVNPCAAVLCEAGSNCVVQNGQAQCVPATTVTCGSVMCAAGQVCCNSSCGICTPPGGVCIQIACE